MSANPVERNQILGQLRTAGYSALEAASGGEAFHLLQIFEQKIDAVVLDDRSGIDAPEIAALISRPAVRILLMSQLDEPQLRSIKEESCGAPRAAMFIRTLGRILGADNG